MEWEPFKAISPPRTVIAHYALNGQMRSKAHRSDCTFGFTSYKDLQMCYEKIIINGQWRNKHFLIVIYQSSLVNAAMIAAWVC